MSRFDNMPLPIPEGVDFKCDKLSSGGFDLTVKGPKGELKQSLPSYVDVSIKEGSVFFHVERKDKKNFAGLSFRLASNLIHGVKEGFSKVLEVNGVGYRWSVSGSKLNLQLGFSHPVEYNIPEGIKVEIGKDNLLKVQGIDKQKVGEVAAQIKSYRPVEPYKGKGVRYHGQYVVRKAGKTSGK